MKKTYIIPELLIVKVAPMRLISESIMILEDTVGTAGLVKENNTLNRSNYNVWNDDWSE